MSDRPAAFTDEVRRAMEAQGLLPAAASIPAAPPGELRYHIAVDGLGQTAGQAPPQAVAAALRALAHQLDPQGDPHG